MKTVLAKDTIVIQGEEYKAQIYLSLDNVVLKLKAPGFLVRLKQPTLGFLSCCKDDVLPYFLSSELEDLFSDAQDELNKGLEV